MKIASYCRVSSEKQEEEKTIDSQIAELGLYAKENNHVVVEKYIDNGYSGSLLARPSLDRLRDDASKGIFEAVLIHSPDRLARKYVYQEIVIEELKNKGIQTIFKNRRIAESPEDQLLLGMQGLIAEFEREKIKERTRRGRLHRANKGLLVGNQAPYGYKYIRPDKNKEERWYEINKEEAKIVKLIFRLLAHEHLSLRKIIKRLYELNIKSPEGKDVWAMSNLSRLVKREDYIGTAYYNKSLAIPPIKPNGQTYKRVKNSSRQRKPKSEWIPINVPAIVEKDIFTLAQEQLKKNQFLSPRNVKRNYLLRGLLFCSKCRSRYTGETTRNYKHYRSTLRIKIYPHKSKCICKSIHGEMIEGLVWGEVHTLLSSPKLIKEQYKKWIQSRQKRSNDQSPKLSDVVDELNNLDKTEQRLIDGYTAGVITLDQLKGKLSDIKLNKTKLEQDKNNLSKNYDFDLMEKISPRGICKEFKSVMSNIKFDKKEMILQRLIKEILIEQNKAIIRGYIPLHVPLENDLRSNLHYCWSS